MTPEEYMKTLQTAADTIEAACGRAEIGVVLGSGLGDYVESLENAKSIAYKDIPGFPVSTVEGHKGRLIFGEAGGRRVGFGRVRAFEGPDPALEPVHEFHFVGQPPEQRLRDVHMALDEARDDDAPGKVDPFRAGVIRASGQPRPHVRDDAVFDEYVRVQDVPRGVHGNDGCVGEQCAHVFSPVVNRGVTLWLAGMAGGGGMPGGKREVPSLP